MVASRRNYKHAVAALALLATPSLAQIAVMSYVGCYKSKGSLNSGVTFQYQSDGYCKDQCVADDNSAVLGLTAGDSCSCGGEVPNNNDKVDDSSCNTPCAGYPQHMCGGTGFYSIYLTGTQDSVPVSGGGTKSSSENGGGSPTTSANPSVITSIAPGRTVVITQSASADAQQTKAASAGPNTTAIAAGVVVGVVALSAIAGGLYFFFRRRRQQAAEEEYKQHQVNDFMAGGGSIPARKVSGPDSRFDGEAMAHRRLSDGSIADNEDYSRRILKVTNPDGSRY